MKRINYLLLLLFACLWLSSCKVFEPSKMLRTGSNYKYSVFPEKLDAEYKIAPNDIISFQLYAKDGFRLIDITSGYTGGRSSMGLGSSRSSSYSSGSSNSIGISTGGGLEFQVEFDGLVKLPLMGRINIAGLTVREVEKLLEEKFASYYNNPFVLLRVTNQRIFIFPGKEGAARVYTLHQSNTTLFEVLADIGGIQDGKAYKIKLIRGDLKNPEVYLIDLSSIKGVKNANLVLQANDIIYIEPRNRISERIVENLTPYLSLVSTLILVYALVYKK